MEIDIEYGGQEFNFPVELIKWGYTYRLVMVLNETEVYFEPDEEGSYRAMVQDNTADIDAGLIEAIIAKLGAIRE